MISFNLKSKGIEELNNDGLCMFDISIWVAFSGRFEGVENK